MTREALTHAKQHVSWARGQGFRAYEVCRSVGSHAQPHATWKEAELCLALALIELRKRA